jgi:AraC-like DNA-binding protein/DNA-binding NarL/FixJ family response regulator
MITIYAIALILILYIWRIGINQAREIKRKKEAVIDELKRQSEEIKAASEDLRQPMARMTSIIGNLSEAEKSLEEREQLNALHSQMLQVITRVSDMQSTLEHPEERAKSSVKSRYELNSKGEMALPNINERLTAEVSRPRRTDAPTSKYIVLLIDDNEDFLRFANSKLRDVYDFHVYNDIRKAAADLETMHADIVVCKQEMRGITGSEFCNQLKMKATTEKTKFVLLTDGVLTPHDMKSMNITMAADDYLAKPFNIQEAIMRFNTLLGLGAIAIGNNLIEGAETRMLESQNSSMTTSTESIDYGEYTEKANALAKQGSGDEMSIVETTIRSRNTPVKKDTQLATTDDQADDDEREDLMSEYSMVDTIDRQLLKNIEQYVLQNMSRGQISLEEMANAMGMGRVPFFHRVRSITNKTPAELVRDLRLKHACVLLKKTNINMSELASNVGFMTAENFISVFKEKFGLSPLEYRLKHRK